MQTNMISGAILLSTILGVLALREFRRNIRIGFDAIFRVGDRIQISNGIEGQVVQINWRSVRIHTDSDDIAIIPNSLIAKAQIINRSVPTQRRSVAVELSCPNETVPERAIETLLEATLLCPSILRTPASSALLTRLGDTHSTYSISFFVENTDQLAATTRMCETLSSGSDLCKTLCSLNA